jgi:hypothetical protein
MTGKLTITEKEFCALVGISPITAWRLRKSHKLPHYKIGGQIFYSPRHVEIFLTTHEHNESSTDTQIKEAA